MWGTEPKAHLELEVHLELNSVLGLECLCGSIVVDDMGRKYFGHVRANEFLTRLREPHRMPDPSDFSDLRPSALLY